MLSLLRLVSLRRASIPAVLFTALASCDGDGGGTLLEPDGQITARLVSGAQQEGVAGRELPQPLVVEVRDRDGAPLAGRVVSWRAGDGGVMEPASGTTGVDGTASARWRLGPAGGAQSASVEVEGLSPLTVAATARLPRAAAVEAVSDTAVDGRAGEPLAEPLAVRVLDDEGAPIAGAEVRWTVTAGGGSVAPATAATDAQGVARSVWTLGANAGEQRAEAAAGTLAPVVFTARSAQVVGPAGGTVRSGDGRLTLQIPAGALDAEHEFTVTPAGAGPAAAGYVRGTAYDLGPDGLVFALPATLSISFDPADLPEGVAVGDLAVHRRAGDTWAERPGSTVAGGGTSVSAPLEGLSVYGVLARRPVASLAIDPERARAASLGMTIAFRVVMRDASGHSLDASAREVAWSSSEEPVATVDADGVATAVDNGTARITARVGGASASAVFRVEQVPVSLTVTPDTLVLPSVGASERLSTRVEDELGNRAPTGEVEWESEDPSVATVAGGVVTAMAPGSTRIRARLGQMSERVEVVVKPLAPSAADDSAAPDSEPGDALHGALNAPLAVAAGGLLANDDLGGSALIESFGAIQTNDGAGNLGAPAGTVTAHAAGTTATVGDGSLTVNGDGSLTLVPPTDYTGLLRFSYRLKNSEGTDDATVTLAVGERPAAADDVYDVLGNVGISVPAAAGIFANDSGDLISYVSVAHESGTQGSISVGASTGSVTYTPATGYEGTDEFTYTIRNGFGSAQGTLTLDIAGMIWFVDEDATSAGNGRLTSPFPTLAAFVAAGLGGEGDAIFLHESAEPYTGGITLKDGQRLIGQDASQELATLAGVTVPAHSVALPAMNAGAGDEVVLGGPAGVVLGSDNRLHGLRIDVTSGTALSGSDYGTLLVRDAAIASDDGAVHLDDGTADVRLTSTTGRGGAYGIRILDTGGTVSLGTGSIQGTTSASLHVRGGDADISYAGSLSMLDGRPVIVENGTGGSLTLSGKVSTPAAIAGSNGILIAGDARTVEFTGEVELTLNGAGTTGVTVDGLAGGTVRFSGGLDAAVVDGAGLTATGTGTLEITGADNALRATQGPGLSVTGLQIGANGLTLEYLASVGGTNGVLLSGTSGGAVTIGVEQNVLISEPSGAGIVIDDVSNAVSFGETAIMHRKDVGIDIDDATAPISFGVTTINNSEDAEAPAIDLNRAAHVTMEGDHDIRMNGAGADVDAIVLRSSTLEMTGGTVDGASGDAFAIASTSNLRLTDVTVDGAGGRGIQSEGGQIDLSGTTMDDIGGSGIFLNPNTLDHRLRMRNSRIGATGQTSAGTWAIQTTTRRASIVLEDVTFGLRDGGALSIRGTDSLALRCVSMTNVTPDGPLNDPEYRLQGGTDSKVRYHDGGGVIGNVDEDNVEHEANNNCPPVNF